MKLKIATGETLAFLYENLLKKAFPPAELKPLASIEGLIAAERYAPLCLFEGEEPLGVIFLWLGEDDYTLIDYLAVSEKHRNEGIGARLLREAFTCYPTMTFLGESEAPTGNPATDAMILRRLGFYDRANAQILNYDTAAFGVRYKTLLWARRPLDDDDIVRHHQDFYKKQFSEEMYEKYIQIPIAEGEPLKPCIPWTEA